MTDEPDNPGVSEYPRLLSTCLPYSWGCLWTERPTSPPCRPRWCASSAGRLWEAGWRSRCGSFGR